MDVIRFWLEHRAEVLALLGQHVLLAGLSTLVATAIAVPLGIAAAHRPRLSAPLVGLANAVQTVPSLAMFGFLLPLPLFGGIGIAHGDRRPDALRAAAHPADDDHRHHRHRSMPSATPASRSA